MMTSEVDKILGLVTAGTTERVIMESLSTMKEVDDASMSEVVAYMFSSKVQLAVTLSAKVLVEMVKMSANDKQDHVVILNEICDEMESLFEKNLMRKVDYFCRLLKLVLKEFIKKNPKEAGGRLIRFLTRTGMTKVNEFYGFFEKYLDENIETIVECGFVVSGKKDELALIAIRSFGSGKLKVDVLPYCCKVISSFRAKEFDFFIDKLMEYLMTEWDCDRRHGTASFKTLGLISDIFQFIKRICNEELRAEIDEVFSSENLPWQAKMVASDITVKEEEFDTVLKWVMDEESYEFALLLCILNNKPVDGIIERINFTDELSGQFAVEMLKNMKKDKAKDLEKELRKFITANKQWKGRLEWLFKSVLHEV